MKVLRGQNLRVLEFNYNGDMKATVIAKATNCVVTLNTTTDDVTTKDDVGNASKPMITSKGWTVQVDSLNVASLGHFMNAAKNGTKLGLMFDRVATTDNQSPTSDENGIGRYGDAIVTDLTFNFNDRELSSFNAQFSGTGDLTTSEEAEANVIDVGDGYDGYMKGQFIRLFLSDTTAPNSPVAAAKQLSFHVSVQTENITTKDVEDDWDEFEVVGISYDISSNALIYTGDDASLLSNAMNLPGLMVHYEAEDLMYWEIAYAVGTHNRTKGDKLLSGQAWITQLTINAQNRQVVNYTTQLSGCGAFTVHAPVTSATPATP